MVTVIKHEWHSVDSQFEANITAELLAEIYPDQDESEIESLLEDLKNGDFDIETLVEDARENNVDIEWDRTYDDWWSERKGGFEVTYELSED